MAEGVLTAGLSALGEGAAAAAPASPLEVALGTAEVLERRAALPAPAGGLERSDFSAAGPDPLRTFAFFAGGDGAVEAAAGVGVSASDAAFAFFLLTTSLEALSPAPTCFPLTSLNPAALPKVFPSSCKMEKSLQKKMIRI